MHVLEVVRLRHSLRLTHHTGTNILILICNTLVRHICWRLSRLPHTEFEQLFDVLGRDLRRSTLPNLNDLAFRIVVRLWRVLLHDARAVVRSVVHLVRVMRAMPASRTLA